MWRGNDSLPGGGSPARAGRALRIAAGLALASCVGGVWLDGTGLEPPTAQREALVELLHDRPVADPYRWLERLDAPRTRAWLEAQSSYTEARLAALPGRAALAARIEALADFDRYGMPVQRGGRYFFSLRRGLEDQPQLVWARRLDREPNVLLDVNALSPDRTTGLRGWAPDPEGRRVAYALSEAGSDWQEWHVRDVATGRDLEPPLRWVKFSGIAWSPDGSGFYYSRYAPPREGDALRAPNRGQQLFYHALGTLQAEDRLVHARPDRPEWLFGASVSDDGRYLLVSVRDGSQSGNRVLVRELESDAPLRPLVPGFDSRFAFIGHARGRLLFRTDRDAPLGRVVAIDPRRPGPELWREIVPESDDTLQAVRLVGGRLIALYLRDAHSRLRVFSGEGERLADVPLPGLGSVRGLTGRAQDRYAYYAFTSFTLPAAQYRLDMETLDTQPVRAPRLQFDPERYTSRQVFYRSRDGTRVPMFLVHRADVDVPGPNAAPLPTYLYGYGGFGASLTPAFSLAHLTWLELGGLFAQVNLRGGGEYGRAWHEAGKRLRKQTVFDDFIAAAEWLIEEGYTRPERLAIGGRSNGGLLVGAAITQRPELFAAAVPVVGVFDMLRFDRFTIGWAWRAEYGSPADPREFEALRAYSPYHNVVHGRAYPATLIATADHDDRVFPAHSFKFSAALQAAQGGDAPILLRVERRAGHGVGRSFTSTIAELVDRWSFVAASLELDLEAALANRAP